MHSYARQHQVNLQQDNTDVWLQPAQLGSLWKEAEELESEPVGL